MPATIGDKASLETLIAETEARFGPVDILVCNAASNPYYGPMSGITDEQFRKILDNNILANHWLVSLVTPQMRQRQGGVIIIVSSIGGLVGSPVIGAYNISKAADMQLARNLAVELGPDNIRVNCIAPGLIRTDFSRALWQNPETLERYTRIRRCAASASRARSPGRRCSSPRRQAVFSPARPSSSMAARPSPGCDTWT